MTVLGGGRKAAAGLAMALLALLCSPAETHRLIAVRLHGKTGYVDAAGKLRIQPIYDAGQPFSQGRAVVQTGRRTALIDEVGREITAPAAERIDSFHDGLAVFKTSSGFGYVDRSGRVAIAPEFAAAQAFSEGLAAVRRGDAWGYIDKAGAWVIEPRFENAGPFACGLAPARPMDAEKAVFINKTGAQAIEAQFDDTAGFTATPAGPMAAIRSGRQWRFIRTDGAQPWPGAYADAGPFSEATAPVLIAGRWRYIGVKGDAVLNLAVAGLEYAWPFREDRARIRVHGKTGFISRRGQVIVAPRFDAATDFSGGVATVRLGGREGVIERSGAFVWRLSE